MRLYSLHKSRSILSHQYALFKRRQATLPPDVKSQLLSLMKELDQAILDKKRTQADALAHKVEELGEKHLKQTPFEHLKDFLFGIDAGWSLVPAILLALCIALLVRQMWFEPFEIPTGSMRPTFKEQDHLTVTKTAFGINYPMKTDHLYFDPALVQRTSILIFSADKLPIRDPDSTFLWIFPYKKRLIKRLAGKPGDSFYFYGGKLYGVDSEGNPLSDFLTAPWMNTIEYIPFLSFDGKKRQSNNQLLFYHMNLPVGRISPGRNGEWVGEVFNGKAWVPDQPASQKKMHKTIQSYTDFLGMNNYGMTRIVSKEEALQELGVTPKELEEAPLYLQILHHPNLTYPKPYIGYTGLSLTPLVSLLPLKEQHLQAIMDTMYTARFVVRNGRAARYNVEGLQFDPSTPRFDGVPDGTYEFYFGKALKVGWGAITYDLPKDHPLYKRDNANIKKLYNYGIELSSYATNRYAYFRDGDFYLLGAPIMKKEDPTLKAFLEKEQKKEQQSSESKPYIAFKDNGPPLKEGKYDVDFIRTFGVTLPEKQYLVLGDNHAMSEDSRVFGFVPQNNLQGAPCYIIWPPGSRWGAPPQKPYPTFNTPRIIVWGIAALIALIWYAIHRRNSRRPIISDKSQEIKIYH